MKITVSVFGIILLSLVMTSVGFGQDILLSIPASSGPIGTEVNIPVNIGNTTGRNIIAADVTIEYSSRALGDVGANVAGTIADGWLIFTNTATPGKVVISMAGVNALSGSGTLLNLQFTVRPTAQIGVSYPLNIASAILNDGNPGSVTQGGTFTTEPGGEPGRMLGDANGDDRVNHLDLLKVILSYGKGSGDNGFDANADFNGDGRVNRDDVIILWRNFGAVNQ